jgi:hypothetical protein
MVVAYGLPEPAERRFGEFGALAEPFLRRTRKSDALHLGFHNVETPEPEGNFFGALHLQRRQFSINRDSGKKRPASIDVAEASDE